jgi:hypothetical protein
MKKKIKNPQKAKEIPSEGGRRSTSTNPFKEDMQGTKATEDNQEEPNYTQLPVQKHFANIRSRRYMRKIALWDTPNSSPGLGNGTVGTDPTQGIGAPFSAGGETQTLGNKRWEDLWNRFTRMTQNFVRNPKGGNAVKEEDALDSGQAISSEDSNP